MGLYSKYFLPRLVHLSCSSNPTMRQRQKLVPLAHGRVLEVGIGSGLNLPFYDPERVTEVVGLDPSPELIRMAARPAASASFDVAFVTAGGEEIPLDSGSFDTVLLTYTLCTIPDYEPALRELARVLTPGGRLLFCEHGLAPDPGVRRWQDRLDPVWRRLAGGCHLNRNVPDLLDRGGFEIEGMETMYVPGWRPASYNYWGSAAPR
jgi:ubiquinone/menaquinone biosynthesis C-methylase UbiE